MSLHDLANHVQSAGRGEDKVLVHMTPGEVSGLQSLAMAHGGSLTVNPETGLPEAGFLKSLLPMAIGFGLAPFTGGMSAALITGAGYTAATGSLKKGIMAGLGAYGGAGLAGGLSSLGTAAAAPAQAGLSPAVAANTSTAAANNMFANVGAQPLQFTDDILAGVAKTPVTGPGQSVVFNQAGAAATPLPTYAQTQANILNSPMLKATPVSSVAQPGASLPTSLAERQAVLADQIGGFDVTGGATKAIRPPSLLDRAAGAPTTYPDTSTLKPGGSWAQTGTGRYTITNPNASSTNVPIEARTPTLVEKPVVRTELSGGPVASDAQSITGPYREYMSRVGQGAKTALSGPDGLKALYSATEAAAPYSAVAGLGSTAMNYYDAKREEAAEEMRRRANQSTGLIRPYEFDYGATGVASQPYAGSAERTYFQPSYTALTPYEAPGPEYRKAGGGLTALAVGGPVEEMSALNSVGANTGYPMASINTSVYSNPMMQRPEAVNVIAPSADAGVGAYSGEPRYARGGATKEPQGGYTYDYNPQTMQFTQTKAPSSAPSSSTPFNLVSSAFEQATNKQSAPPNGTVTGGMTPPVMQPRNPAQPLMPSINIPAYQTPEQQLGLGGFYDYMNQQMGSYAGYAAGGGISHLGDYSDGGRLLKGPGDGVSDSIPASIGNRQPARLADGEFVVPARIVSEIGNGSTEAGARKLYAMMDRVQKARRKTVGKDQVARNTKAEKLLPA